MSTLDKLKERFKKLPSDFSFDELERLLNSLGYELDNKGKTSGSRCVFIRQSDKKTIMLHKPHGRLSNPISHYALKDIYSALVARGDIDG